MSLIMVIDDAAVIRQPIEAALRQEGFETIGAENGLDALARLVAHQPDVILLDLAMPVLDGAGFLEKLRADPRHADTPVIVLTALADRTQVVRVAHYGIQGYMLKTNFSLKDLVAKVREVMKPAAGTGAAPAAPETPKSQPTAAKADQVPTPADPAGAATSAAATAPKPHSAPVTDVLPPAQVVAQPRRAVAAPPPTSSEALKSLQPMASREQVVERLAGCDQLKAFSPAVAQLLNLTANPQCSLDRVVRTIGQDHAIALKMLKLANSVVYSRGEPVDSVRTAVMRIGLHRIRQTILNIGVVEQFGSAAFRDRLNFAEFWEHAVAVGVIAAQLAQVLEAKTDPETAFTMGLLHDVGRAVCLDRIDDLYARVLQTAAELELPLEQVEARMLLINHADVIELVLRAWKFPLHLVTPIACHHLSADSLRHFATKQWEETAILALANRLAHALLLGSSGNQTIYPTDDLCKLLKIDPAVMESVEAKACEETTDIKLSMITHAGMQVSWESPRDRSRAALAGPFRPLFVSAAPRTDAFRIFCDQLRAFEEGPPNLGVVHIANPRQRTEVTQAFRAAEARAGVAGLPLLLLSPTGELALEDAAMAGRHYRLLSTPVVISRFLRAVNEIVATPEQAAAA